jgi:phosphatidylserine/phosphatidylglycerophosphate/cardiolipin synthase-like enzyme
MQIGLLLFLQWQVFFSPNGGGEQAVIRNIDSTRSHLLVQAYSFTSEPIANALIRARERGCYVSIILDKGQRKVRGSQWQRCQAHGIPVIFDLKTKIQHSKVMIIDSIKVITGSFNFSKAAEKNNVENLLIVKDSHLAEQYLRSWYKRKQQQ